ncbi:MAG: hypothetical protein ACM3X0_14170 [Bacteroidota bacterium]
MTSAGRLTVRARRHGNELVQAVVELQRPAVARLFIGQPPEAVVKTVPYLYTLCAHAQRSAAQAALAAAADELRRPVDDTELWIEFLHENLWRLLLDWPPALGLAPAGEAFVAWRASRHGGECLAETRKLLAGPLRELAGRCLEQFAEPKPAISGGLAPLTPKAWLDYWRGRSSAAPTVCRPASPAAAYRARLVDVDLAVAALADNRPYPVAAAGGGGWGIGQTLTARGVLTHAAQIDRGLVRRYRVWAPTDCHFADADGVERLLAGRRFADPDAARRGLEQAVLALDPCLPYVLELEDA